EDLAHSALPGDREAVHPGSSDESACGAERHRLEDVASAPDTAVEEDRYPSVRDIDDPREGVERADRAVDLPTAVVGDHDPVDPGPQGALRVIRMLDAFENDRQARVRLSESQFVPGERWAREHVEKGL